MRAIDDWDYRYRTLKFSHPLHPLLQQLFDEMAKQRCSLGLMADRAGLNKQTLFSWKSQRRASPSLLSVAACFEVLGYELVVRPIKDED